MSSFVIGVDGGGTKTKSVAVDIATGKIAATATVGGINACTITLPRAAENLLESIRALGIEYGDVKAVAIGDPAIDDSSPSHGKELLSALANSGLLRASAEYYSKSDVFMALYAYTRGKAGALIVAGTGSMGVALAKPYRRGDGDAVLTVGGWGEPTRDNGSGYYIAVNGIEAAMDAFDKVAPETELCAAAKDFFRVKDERDLIGVFNGDGLKKSETAAFAKCVDECAERGDGVAADILNRAGVSLGKYAVSLLKRLPESGRKVGTYGSVLVNNKKVRESFISTVKSVFPNAAIEIPKYPPEIGAAIYALDMLGIKSDKYDFN